jgi:hypothetical protein
MIADGPDLAMRRFLGNEQFEHIGAHFRQKQLDRLNDEKAISSEERELVQSVFAKRRQLNPKKYGAYKETADELGMKARRVRYIIEGRR